MLLKESIQECINSFKLSYSVFFSPSHGNETRLVDVIQLFLFPIASNVVSRNGHEFVQKFERNLEVTLNPLCDFPF